MSEERKPIRQVFVWRNNEWVPREEAPPVNFHYVITDEMAPVRSMADGQMYDSKSRIRSTYRARGLREVGNEKVWWSERSETSDPTPQLLRAFEEVSKKR
jgi:hypothetical protein